jgi:predicted transposase/invertase (TIGR01784 family)
MAAGRDYRESPNVIAINIVNYEFLPEIPAFHTSFHIWEDTYREVLLTDALEIRFIEMVKFRRLAEKDIWNEPLHRWLTWFDQGSPASVVEEVIKMDRGIQKAEEKMAYVSIDKEALREYQMREMALSDWTSGLNYARREGMREGIQQGRREGKQEGRREGMREIAANLKRRGVPIDHIAEDTGLSVEAVAKL